MKLRCFTIVCLLLTGLHCAVDSAWGLDLFASRQRSRSKCCIPAHNYDNGTQTAIRKFKVSAIAVAASNPTNEGRLHKPFHFRAKALTLDHLTLDQVGLSIDKYAGRVIATGRITHSGGDGGLIGSNVTIRIRAFVSHTANATNSTALLATPNEVNQIPPDAFYVWSSEHKFWVQRGGPHHKSLVNPCDKLSDLITLERYFEQITHIEVEMEYQQDR